MTSIIASALIAGWGYGNFLAEPAPPKPPTAPPAVVLPVSAPPVVAFTNLTPGVRYFTPATPPPRCKCDSCECNASPPVVNAPMPPPSMPPEVAPIAPKAARTRPRPPPAAPVRYRLADATGQIWDHTDPAYLSNFVASRNAARAYASPAYFSGASACSTGRFR